METYTYKILGIDAATHTMLVQYTPTDAILSEISLNLSIPDSLDNIDAYVNTYAPQDTWYRVKNPAFNLNSIVGIEKAINPEDLPVNTMTNVVTIPNDQLAAEMSRLEAEFFAEQGNS